MTWSDAMFMPPNAHHGRYHMTNWPWRLRPAHIAYPLLFVTGLAIVVILLWRSSQHPMGESSRGQVCCSS